MRTFNSLGLTGAFLVAAVVLSAPVPNATLAA
jgi:hypothetical protein